MHEPSCIDDLEHVSLWREKSLTKAVCCHLKAIMSNNPYPSLYFLNGPAAWFMYVCLLALFHQLFTLFFSFYRTPESVSVCTSKTQEQQKTEDSVYHFAAASFREEVSPEAVPLHRGKSGVFQFTQSYRDTSEDMVPKQESKSKETSRSRVRETKTGLEASVTGVCLSLPAGSARGFSRSIRSLELFPAAFTARAGTFRRTCYLWDVLFVLNVFTVIKPKDCCFASHKRPTLNFKVKQTGASLYTVKSESHN